MPENSIQLPSRKAVTAKEALRTSEVRYRRLFETAQDGILILDATSGEITDVNPFLLHLLGYARGELLGKQLWEIGFFKDRALSESTFEKLRKEHYVRYENLPLQSKDGRPHEVEFVSNLYEADHHDVMQCNIRDITARKAMEARQLHAQKMQAVGQLAGGMAHDYNNILASTTLQLGLLLDDPSLSESIKTSLRTLEHQADRAAGLTEKLLLFSHQHVVALKPTDLTAALAGLLVILRPLMGSDVSLEFRADTAPLWIEADAIMIKQVVMNLCLNARDAMGAKGGRLSITASPVELDPAAARANPEARPGLFACLAVADTGCGMEAATLQRLFEPFFTTKDVGKGTGLGLSTVHGIAKQHGGWVEVASRIREGSTFRVYLPALARTLPDVLQFPSRELREGRRTILVVEDEAIVRSLVTQRLLLQGYVVLEAANGPEAVQVWDQHPGEIDLLFTDMRMPEGMTGLELFERLKRTKATLKGVISSGYSAEIVALQGATRSGLTFLPKPYNAKALVETVHNCLA